MPIDDITFFRGQLLKNNINVLIDRLDNVALTLSNDVYVAAFQELNDALTTSDIPRTFFFREGQSVPDWVIDIYEALPPAIGTATKPATLQDLTSRLQLMYEVSDIKGGSVSVAYDSISLSIMEDTTLIDALQDALQIDPLLRQGDNAPLTEQDVLEYLTIGRTALIQQNERLRQLADRIPEVYEGSSINAGTINDIQQELLDIADKSHREPYNAPTHNRSKSPCMSEMLRDLCREIQSGTGTGFSHL